MVTTSTITALFALFGLGGSLGFVPLAEAVAEGGSLAGLGVVTVLAVALLGSLFGTSRFNRHVPVAVGVTHCIDIGVGVGVTAGAGVSGVTLIGASRGSYIGSIAMFSIQNVYFPTISLRCHGDIDGNSSRRNRYISICFEFRIDHVTGQRLHHTVVIKPSNAGTVAGKAIDRLATEGGSPNSIAFLDREGDGILVTGSCNTPSVCRVILIHGIKQYPNIRSGTEFIRKLLQSSVRIKHTFGGDNQITGYSRDGDQAVSIHLIGNVHTTHCNRNTVSTDSFYKGFSLGNTFIIMQGSSCIGQTVMYGINHILAFVHMHIRKKCTQNSIGDIVTTGCIRMNPIGQISGGYTAITQIHIGHTVVIADRPNHSPVGLYLFRCKITGAIVGQHDHNLCIGIVVSHAQNRRHIRIGKRSPLGFGKIRGNRGSSGIKASQWNTSAHIITATKKQDHIRLSVRAQILDTGERSHCRVFAKITGISVHGIQHLRACPAVVDTKLGIQRCKYLHPPGLIHICQ